MGERKDASVTLASEEEMGSSQDSPGQPPHVRYRAAGGQHGDRESTPKHAAFFNYERYLAVMGHGMYGMNI